MKIIRLRKFSENSIKNLIEHFLIIDIFAQIIDFLEVKKIKLSR